MVEIARMLPRPDSGVYRFLHWTVLLRHEVSITGDGEIVSVQQEFHIVKAMSISFALRSQSVPFVRRAIMGASRTSCHEGLCVQ